MGERKSWSYWLALEKTGSAAMMGRILLRRAVCAGVRRRAVMGAVSVVIDARAALSAVEADMVVEMTEIHRDFARQRGRLGCGGFITTNGDEHL
jgi:hypothetical protein